MKKMLKKMGLAVLMMALTGNVVMAAIAEEETPAPAPVTAEAPAPVEEKPSEPAPAPAEEKPTEEATVEATVEATIEPAAEATVEPTEEATAEPTVEPTEEATVEPTAEPAEEATAEPTPFAFTGKVSVKLRNEGDIYFGDTVTLRAVVSDANADYEIRWEVNKTGRDSDWKVISGETSKTYSFTVTEENAEYAYRAVLVVAE